MKTHPYLRAYMAGIVVPTMLLLVAMSVFSGIRRAQGPKLRLGSNLARAR